MWRYTRYCPRSHLSFRRIHNVSFHGLYIKKIPDTNCPNNWPTGQQLANSRTTVDRQSANCWLIVGQLSADCRLPPSTKICQQSADCWQFVGRLSAACRLFVGQVSVKNPCRIPEKPQLAGKNIAYRREMKLSHLSSPYCFGFFRDQSPRNPIASSSQSRSKKFVYSGFLQFL